MATETAPVDREWMNFRDALERAIGVPLGAYKEPQMKRRLTSVMDNHGIANYAAFTLAIRTNQKLLDQVKDTLTINVSEFFRQADRFDELRKKWLPEMLKARPNLKIWSAGCSIGCEPYTLAIILNELDPGGRHTILATDVDMPILARAREGTGYLPSEVRAVPPALLKKYFTTDGKTYAVDPSLRSKIQFRRQDLLKDPYPTDQDMVLCRNVVIYFTEEAKAKIYEGFSGALRPNGVLFIGGSEMIMHAAEAQLKSSGLGFYQRAA
jgi:chemotaxis protein methyltransferase CheR